MDDAPFPSMSKECHGHWVGISENVGNFMTFKVLTDDTLKVIHHLNMHLVHDPDSKDMNLDPPNKEPPTVIKLLWKTLQDSSSTSLVHGETPAPAQNSNDDASTMAIINLQDLVGQMFLMDEHEDGQHFHTCIIECIDEHEEGHHKADDHIKFQCSINENAYEEIITYNELMDFI